MDSSYYEVCTSCPEGKFVDNTANPPDACPITANCPEDKCTGEGDTHCDSLDLAPVKECSPCPAGKYGLGGRQLCMICESGKYSNLGAKECESCSVGKYISDDSADMTKHEGASSCDECVGESTDCTGYFSPDGCKSCNSCVRGKYYNGDDECEVCGSGKYTNKPGQLRCKSCPKGKYNYDFWLNGQNVEHHDSLHDCIDCQAGKFQSDPGQTSCSDCPENHFSQSNATECEPCPHGTATSMLSGRDECVSDNVGIWSDDFFWYKGEWIEDPGFWSGPDENCALYTTCGTCDEWRDNHYITCGQCKENSAPKMISLPNSDSCHHCDGSCETSCQSEVIDECEVKCGAGLVRFDGSSCDVCPEGKFKGEDDDACKWCTDGQVPDDCERTWHGANDEGCKTCKTCPAGTYKKWSGVAIFHGVGCEVCPEGKISSSDGASECTSCEEHHVTDPASCLEPDTHKLWGSWPRKGCSSCVYDTPVKSPTYNFCPSDFSWWGTSGSKSDSCYYLFDANNPENNHTMPTSLEVYKAENLEQCLVNGDRKWCAAGSGCDRQEVDEFWCYNELESQYEREEDGLFRKNAEEIKGGNPSPFQTFDRSSCASFSRCTHSDSNWFIGLGQTETDFVCNQCDPNFKPGGFVRVDHGDCHGW
ncbi:hypothetical protein TrLO_g10563 [Triparma laevis f. longispina]|uniref:4Fe-4S ferredoxin-type domain-containing protein n=1 Tax=Triparma laevis f. longispina TaxID=1714387 RepID=A0A9W7FTH0_9STRA|nr:hypothetical protein TrLO_g10563 [Triparma laevis f. longispina]